MSINFATCDRKRALSFLQKVYPSRVVSDSPDSAGPLLDFVEKDIIRIQDPMVHAVNGTIQAIPGKNWDESYREQVVRVAIKFAEPEKADENGKEIKCRE